MKDQTITPVQRAVNWNRLQDDKDLEVDKLDDPRFSMTPEQLKEKGIEDFQLYYALATLQRTTLASSRLAATRPVAARSAATGRPVTRRN